MESKGPAGDESDARVHRLDECLRESMLEHRLDLCLAPADRAGQGDEGLEAGAAGPGEPALEELHASMWGQLQDLPELLLEQVGAVERGIGPCDGAELGSLSLSQVLRVLPEGEA